MSAEEVVLVFGTLGRTLAEETSGALRGCSRDWLARQGRDDVYAELVLRVVTHANLIEVQGVEAGGDDGVDPELLRCYAEALAGRRAAAVGARGGLRYRMAYPVRHAFPAGPAP